MEIRKAKAKVDTGVRLLGRILCHSQELYIQRLDGLRISFRDFLYKRRTDYKQQNARLREALFGTYTCPICGECPQVRFISTRASQVTDSPVPVSKLDCYSLRIIASPLPSWERKGKNGQGSGHEGFCGEFIFR